HCSPISCMLKRDCFPLSVVRGLEMPAVANGSWSHGQRITDDRFLVGVPHNMTPTLTQAKIHIERMMYRSSIAVTGESAASYALVKLIPAGGGATQPLGLNLALVLDVSGSMYEEDGTGISRLKRIQQAATAAIQKLNPDDSLAIVAFAHNAE